MQQYIDRCQLLNKLTVIRFSRRHSKPSRSFTVDDCLRIVQDFPPSHLWVPVTERLPQPESVVLCAFDSGEVSSLRQEWSLSQAEDPFLDETEASPRRVTHWMPLPAAPGKGGLTCPATT